MNLAFLSGNSICGVIDINPVAATAGPTGSSSASAGTARREKEELENGFPEEALFTKNGPNEATLMGARSTYPDDRRRRLDLPQARPLAVRRHGHEGRRRNPRAWSAGSGTATPRRSRGWRSSPAARPRARAPKAPTPRRSTPGPKDNFVFNAATIWWADGLSEPPGYIRPAVYTQPQGPDNRVQQITANLLDRMRGSIGMPCDRGASAKLQSALAKTIHPPRGGCGQTRAAAIGAAETSSSGKTSSIRKPGIA